MKVEGMSFIKLVQHLNTRTHSSENRLELAEHKNNVTKWNKSSLKREEQGNNHKKIASTLLAIFALRQ